MQRRIMAVVVGIVVCATAGAARAATEPQPVRWAKPDAGSLGVVRPAPRSWSVVAPNPRLFARDEPNPRIWGRVQPKPRFWSVPRRARSATVGTADPDAVGRWSGARPNSRVAGAIGRWGVIRLKAAGFRW